jgi:hypothetical protein
VNISRPTIDTAAIFYSDSMGRRKFRIGRIHKNCERRRQSTGKCPIGRPSKVKKGNEEVNAVLAKLIIITVCMQLGSAQCEGFSGTHSEQ